ncbi:hypothetical protein NQ315_009611 [Exocentrus adspersus]|uniref:CLIP domain-containing serine protease n=1 Tax=Exocentrus adspersus TaxID=1586481 RepID=A0AAV8WGP7_9CUCU|nr:hypothetical protein NQ315_009611 [Exocentrus adspersus]
MRTVSSPPSSPTNCSESEICIPIRDCPFFDDLLKRVRPPRPSSVIQIMRKKMCDLNKALSIPYMCCDRTTLSPTKREDRDSPSRETTTKAPELISRHRNFHLLRNDICGPISNNLRITSGEEVGIEEFPWMALVVYYTGTGYDLKCGGTIINERYVLTAGHCVHNFNIAGVKLGEYNLDTMEDCLKNDNYEDYCAPPPQDFLIETMKVHPEYNPKTFENDIALLRLATPANFSFCKYNQELVTQYFTRTYEHFPANIKPICLPLSEMDLTGKSVIVSGWGVTETGLKSSVLMKVSLPVAPISECQKKYESFAPVTNKQICAGGYKGRDSCTGDSGGPMKYVDIVDGTPRYIQYGIVSYGPKHCGIEGRPGIYTRVARYIRWILDNLQPDVDD